MGYPIIDVLDPFPAIASQVKTMNKMLLQQRRVPSTAMPMLHAYNNTTRVEQQPSPFSSLDLGTLPPSTSSTVDGDVKENKAVVTIKPPL